MNDIGVSVFVYTYNQKEYIKQTLDSILNQKTNFKFEILVHDDASIDGTKEIVAEYANAYPEIIVPFYEEINMFAHCEEYIDRMFSKARGKYCAICDGDDYWIGTNKLQKQYDFMEANPDYALCAHNSLILDMNTGMEHKVFERKTMELPQGEVIEKACSQFSASSHFFRLEPWYKQHGGNDLSDLGRVLWNTNEGRVMCFEDVMSVYRVNTKGSWSASINNSYVSISDLMSRVVYYRKFDELTSGKWHDNVDRLCTGILSHVFSLLRNDYRKFGFVRKLSIALGVIADLFGVWPVTTKVRARIYKYLERRKK